jgi:hypothetical protein
LPDLSEISYAHKSISLFTFHIISLSFSLTGLWLIRIELSTLSLLSHCWP